MVKEFEFCVVYNKEKLPFDTLNRDRILKVLSAMNELTQIDLEQWEYVSGKENIANLTSLDFQTLVQEVGQEFGCPLNGVFDFVSEMLRDAMTMNPMNSFPMRSSIYCVTGSPELGTTTVPTIDPEQMLKVEIKPVLTEATAESLKNLKEIIQNSIQEALEQNLSLLYNELTLQNNFNAYLHELIRIRPLKSTGPFQTFWSKIQSMIINQKKPEAAPIGSLPSKYHIWFPNTMAELNSMSNTQANELVIFYGLSYPNNLSFGASDHHLKAKIDAIRLHICGN